MRTGTDVQVEKAHQEQHDLIAHREHCSLDSRLLDQLGLCVRRQIRLVHATAGPALFTVSEERHEAGASVIRMGAKGRARLDVEAGFPAVLDLGVTDAGLSDADAQRLGGFVERLDDRGAVGLAVLAPHGGGIEPGTDCQAEAVGRRLGRDRCSVWRCRGWWPGAPFERWHITSTDIDPRSFPLLRRIRDRGFAHAVAFHGTDAEAVLVGGLAPVEIRRAVVEAVAAVVDDPGIEVRLATASDGLNGDAPANIVNRLTADGRTGVQIEQSRTARDRFGPAIARAVADVYAQLLRPDRP